MSLLGRDQILVGAPLASADVDIPEWGGTVRVREMTAGERDAFDVLLVEDQHLDLRDYRAKLLAATACDEEGKLLFGQGDLEALTKLGAGAMDRLFEAAARLNHLTSGDMDALGKVFAARGGASSSVSPSSSAVPSERSDGA